MRPGFNSRRGSFFSFLWGFSSSGRAVDSHSTGRGIDAPNLQKDIFLRRCDGVVNVTDLKSVPFGGAGSNPANVFLGAFLAQSAERCANNFSKTNRCNAAAAGSIPAESSFLFGGLAKSSKLCGHVTSFGKGPRSIRGRGPMFLSPCSLVVKFSLRVCLLKRS